MATVYFYNGVADYRAGAVSRVRNVTTAQELADEFADFVCTYFPDSPYVIELQGSVQGSVTVSA